MTDVRVIGIDPGPIPGIVVLDVVRPPAGTGDPAWVDDAQVMQCTPELALGAVLWLATSVPGVDVLVQVERFLPKGRLNAAQRLTDDMVRDVQAVLPDGVPAYLRPAAAVKPWATDERLERAGLAELTKGMRHARDAGRHALFCAVHEVGVPDPLSKRWRR